MAILITGGAGYIGTHTCVELINKGNDIVIVDNFNNSSAYSLIKISEITKTKVKFYEVDILNRDSLERVFEENNIEAVIHFAGYKSVSESVKEPLIYYSNNVIGTIILCETMRKYNVKKLVFSSSATVYSPVDTNTPISEDFPLGATNPYGRTKLIIEKMLSDLYVSDNQWSIALLRYFNPVGAHPTGLIGESPKGTPNNLIPYITQVAVGRLKELKVFGNDYSTPDGTGVRDYIHVQDLAVGHIKALDKVLTVKGVNAYNLGTGKGTSVLEIINIFKEITGMNIPFTYEARRNGDTAICYADVSKARRELGWVAEKSVLEMCADSWNWQVKNPNGL